MVARYLSVGVLPPPLLQKLEVEGGDIGLRVTIHEGHREDITDSYTPQRDPPNPPSRRIPERRALDKDEVTSSWMGVCEVCAVRTSHVR